jgi:hypothetical protein
MWMEIRLIKASIGLPIMAFHVNEENILSKNIYVDRLSKNGGGCSSF